MDDMNRTPRMIADARIAFIAALSKGLSVTGAAEAAGVPVRTIYDWQKADADFNEDWLEALESGADRLEDVALKRATEGVVKPVVSMGKVLRNDDKSIMTITEYNDGLLQFLLIGRRRWKYGTRATEVPTGFTADEVVKMMEADRASSHGDEPGPAAPIL